MHSTCEEYTSSSSRSGTESVEWEWMTFTLGWGSVVLVGFGLTRSKLVIQKLQRPAPIMSACGKCSSRSVADVERFSSSLWVSNSRMRQRKFQRSRFWGIGPGEEMFGLGMHEVLGMADMGGYCDAVVEPGFSLIGWIPYPKHVAPEHRVMIVASRSCNGYNRVDLQPGRLADWRVPGLSQPASQEKEKLRRQRKHSPHQFRKKGYLGPRHRVSSSPRKNKRNK
eukprot:1156139-Pelagomonas_calceolata.AAC.10